MLNQAGLPRAGARATAALAIGVAVATLGPVSPASAVPPAGPTGLNVAQPSSLTTKFNWNQSAGADRYDVQVDNNLDFSSPEVNVTTVNSVYVPEVALQTTTNYWRVRAATGAEKSDWVTGLPFDPPQVTVPIPSSPVDGAHLQQPNDPPLLSWTPSPGATSYTVEVASDPDFVNRLAPFTTETTSLVVSQPLSLGDWFWRVIATKGPGVVSQPSNSSSFWIDPLETPTITGPLGPQPNISADVIDVVLDWDKVPGAVGYELQVATNIDFTAGSIVEDRTGAQKRVLGTRFSPPITYDNNGYYWRVRAVDTAGNSSGWARSQVDFNRQYEKSPELIYPANGAPDVPDPLYFDWKPVTNASEYEIWVGTDENFSPKTYNSCRVAQTTYTPGLFAINDTDLVNVLPNRINEDCDPKPGVTNYWRVRPLDRPYEKPGGGDLPGVQGLWSPTYSFDYTGLSMNNLSPANGATVDVPALSWDPAPGALTYTVRVTNGLGNLVDSATTYATSYTPKGFQRFPTANNPYTWSVYAETAEGTTSLAPQRTFILTGNQPAPSGVPVLTPLTPSPSAQFDGPPALTWEPDPAAATYRVHATYPGGNVLVTKGIFETTAMPWSSFTDTSSELKRPGTYTWWVTAHAQNGAQIGSAGPTSTFTIKPFTAATGHRVALGGKAALDSGSGACTPLTGVCTVPATPVLRWTREPGTAFYMVYVSEDPSFSNLLEPTTALPATTNTIYTPALDNRDWTYADNQTERPYFWFVRPCRAVGQCGPGPVGVAGSAQHSFFKKSPPVTGLQSTLTDKTEVSMSWDNYWHDPASSDPADKWGQTGEPLPQSAMKYRVEIATDSTFSPSAVIDTADVDQTTYTSPSKIYANRKYWWRVQAIDSDGNGLTWSTQEATFQRETPTLNLISPINDVNAPGTTAFRWQAQAYAKGYDVEVYKNDDPTYSVANRVANATNLLTTAYTWNKALAPSASAYRWRVRRIDSSGNPGDWSTGGRFFVTAGTPNIVAPGTGAVQSPNGPVLEWEPLPGASRYTVTITPSGGGSAVIANTVSTAWAVTSKLATGSYTWTLAAKDASGNTLGSSSSTFSVDAALVADLRPTIQSPEGTGVGKTLFATAPTWQGAFTDVTVTYQWLRDGQPIFGTAPSSGTGSTYVIQAVDIGRTLTVKATGSKPNYASGSSTSDGVMATAGDALLATSAPSISGNPAVGSNLTAVPGTWAPTATSYSYKWLRNGSPITNAFFGTYLVTAADAGAQLTVEVTAVRSGYTNGVAVSPPVAIPGTPPGGPGGTAGTLTATAAPVINGTAKVGGYLTATAGTWNSAPTGFKYQWFRAGAPITGATTSIYRATEADASQALTVTVSVTKAGWTDGAATTAPVTIAKLDSTTSAILLPTVLKPGMKSKLMVTVMATGLTGPTGSVVVKDGRKTLVTKSLAASKLGKLTIKLKGFKAGKHKITVFYKGSAATNPSKSKAIKITVRK
ncbi:Ig-like domain repeat protein [Nocardioides KLBMP 9356]|uniref:Ig-like domain repeat protein n=1 Tax=Nocardioides potassii TaxID=2911371 RepID=A0ABS9H7R8_9ACTN|nr:Ig-like domain repeat protein [Nocardioides potassii]MCF6377260.1 Ig-like domain repeat protein [Nocardioides potassii]